MRRLATTLVFLTLGLLALPHAAWADAICHFPPDGVKSPHTLLVSPNSIETHLAHGDSLGACGCPVSACDDYTSFFVQVGAMGRQDGSVENPFGSMSDALKFVEKTGLQCVELQVGTGLYAEDSLAINQDTRILGGVGVSIATSIKNDGAHSLTIENVKFLAANGSSKSSIEVDNKCASTILHNVLFDGVANHGLSQYGGTLEMDDVTVRLTASNGLDPDSGAGVFLSGGVAACLTDMAIDDNANGGLIAEDFDTRVLVTESSVDNNLGCLAGFRVRDNALLLGQALTLTGNVKMGLWISNGGAAHLRDVDITQAMLPEDNCTSNATFDALVSDGLLELTFFSLRQSEIGALGVGSVLNPPTARDGCYKDSLIGVGYRGDNVTADIKCFSGLENNVVLSGNDINLDSRILPVPKDPAGEQICDDGIDNDADGTSDCADSDCDFELACSGVVCAEVDFIHPWCDVVLQAPTPGQLPATCM